MRLFASLLLAVTLMLAQTSDEKDVLAVVQKTFDGIGARDGDMIRSTMLPEAKVYSVRDAGAPAGTAVEDMAAQIAAAKVAMVERFTSPPRVLIRGRIAQVWGEYEFLRDGKFSHCGVDTATLFKTADGWKIATLSYTVERTGCKGQ
uniref:DUF4440 domain-containing protein n=1 Tax=Solibacter usitatus (strain Ellin6076) TaxID=234267 RepID=Q01YZ4_SOLUE